MKDEEGYADRMNSLPKYVVSTTLDNLDWNNSHPVQSEVAEQVAQLKEQPGQDLLVFGSATLVQTLIHHDLVDRYNLLVYPLLRGHGKRLFQEDVQTGLKLVEAQPYSSGVVRMVYQVDHGPA
jgi:dihydrofolate reductase